MKKPVLILAGPTASGKSALAIDIAQMIDAVIINCDSKQVYKEIPIITAQPYREDLVLAEHRLYGCIPASSNCSVSMWIGMVKQTIDEIHAKRKIPLLVGGTGMYIKYLKEGLSQIPGIDKQVRGKVRKLFEQLGNEEFYLLLKEKDPLMADKLNAGDSQRIVRAMEVIEQTGKSLAQWQNLKVNPLYSEEQFLTFFLHTDREQTYKNCDRRFNSMLENGVIEEVRDLLAMNLDPDLPAMSAHGVPEIIAYLRKEMTLDQAKEQAIKNTRHYIKRQFTWYRNQMKDAQILDGNDNKNKVVEAFCRVFV